MALVWKKSEEESKSEKNYGVSFTVIQLRISKSLS